MGALPVFHRIRGNPVKLPSGLWPNAEAVHRSALTHARDKVPWRVFSGIFGNAVDLAYKLWPRDPSFLWHGMSIFAFDGSKYELPATPEIRNEFDPQSGLQYEGRGHYPQCLISTAYDVFRRLPIARSVTGIHGPEREEAQALLPSIPSRSVLLFDRGYPSYELICCLRENHKGYFLFRCPAKSTFPAVEAFVAGGRQEGFILLDPSDNYLKGLSRRQRRKASTRGRKFGTRFGGHDKTVPTLPGGWHCRVGTPSCAHRNWSGTSAVLY